MAQAYRVCAFIIVVCVTLSGCMDSSLRKYSKLETLRAVALIADSPDIAAGSTPTLTAWVADPLGGGRALKVRAVGCVDPGIAFGADPSCEGNATKREIVAETALAWPNSDDAADYAGPVTPTVTLSASDTTAILTGRSAIDKFNGVAYIVIYEIWSTDGAARVTMFKRIVVSDKSASAGQTRNANPTLSDLLGGGASITTFPSAAVELSAQIGAGSAESYKAMSTDGSLVDRVEQIATSWFITDGDVKFFRTTGSDSTLYSPPSARPTGRNAVLIGVARDGRGGESAIKRRLL